jgi:hypothetical protein
MEIARARTRACFVATAIAAIALVPSVSAGAPNSSRRSSGTIDSARESAAPILSLKVDFGCAGNGTSDDTACLKAAGASGRTVLVHPGTYVARDTVALTAGTVFRGEDSRGSILRFSGGSPAEPYNAVALAGEGAGVEGIGIEVTAGDYRRSVEHRASNTFSRRCRIKVTTPDVDRSAYHWAIAAEMGSRHPMQGIVIEQNEIMGGGARLGDAIQASDVPGIQVIRNRIHDWVSTAPDKFRWAIYVSSRSPGALVANNEITTVNVGGIQFGNTPDAMEMDHGRRMIGNSVDGAAYSCLAVYNVKGVIIANNTLARCDILASIYGAEGHVVVGNRFENVVNLGKPQNAARPMIELVAPGANVSGNSFGRSGTAARALMVYRSGATITGNRFDSGSPPSSIWIEPTAADVAVTSNVAQPAVGGGGAIVTARGRGAVIVGNVLSVGSGTAGISVGNADQVVENNRVSGGAHCIHIARPSPAGLLVRGNSCSGQREESIGGDGTTASGSSDATDGAPRHVTGRAVFNGTGEQRTFAIPHGLGSGARAVIVTPGSRDASLDFYAAPDETVIHVTYTAPPPAGTANVILYWSADAE